MYSVMMLTFKKKELLFSTFKYIMERQYAISSNINFPMRSQLRDFCKDTTISSTSRLPKNRTIIRYSPRLDRLLAKVGINRRKYQLIGLGYLLYGNILDTVDYSVFYKAFNMPDTFFSWFLITELHVWMLLVRFMDEGKDGKLVRDNLLEAMWIDIDGRMSKVCPMDSKNKRKQLMKLTGQFYSAVISYDEGILSDDKVLAAALWTIFFVAECNDPEKIELLLIYVRKQMHLLDKISAEEILYNSYIEWIDLKTNR